MQGVLIGNGLYDYTLNSNSMMSFGYGHGLWDTKLVDHCIYSIKIHFKIANMVLNNASDFSC